MVEFGYLVPKGGLRCSQRICLGLASLDFVFRTSVLSHFTIYAKMSSLPERPHRLTVRTPGFQPGNRGSTPRGVTIRIGFCGHLHNKFIR